MPVWVMLYVAVMVLSLPMGVSMLRQLEQDWLHPVGGVLSTLLSVTFVFSYWLPQTVVLQLPSAWLLLGFVLFWDAYTLLRFKQRMPEWFPNEDEDQDAPVSVSAAMWLGIMLMLPAYCFAVLVCLRGL